MQSFALKFVNLCRKLTAKPRKNIQIRQQGAIFRQKMDTGSDTYYTHITVVYPPL